MSAIGRRKAEETEDRPGGDERGVAGRYQLQELLRRDEFGEVWRAFDPRLEREVALRVVPSEMTSDEDLERNFELLCKLVSLSSAGIVKVLDFELDTGGNYYIVTPLPEGASVQQLMEAGTVLPYPRAVDWTRQACRALTEAHAAGLLHQRLTPARCFVVEEFDETDLCQIHDLGLAGLLACRATDAAEATATATEPAAVPADESVNEPLTPAEAAQNEPPAPLGTSELEPPAPAIAAENATPAPAGAAQNATPAPAIAAQNATPAPAIAAENATPAPAGASEVEPPAPTETAEHQPPGPAEAMAYDPVAVAASLPESSAIASVSSDGAALDVHALGVVLYAALTGRVPCDAAPVPNSGEPLTSGVPTSSLELPPGLPSALVRAIQRAIAPEPEERFRTAAEFSEALGAIADGQERVVAIPTPPPPPPPPAADLAQRSGEGTGRQGIGN